MLKKHWVQRALYCRTGQGCVNDWVARLDVSRWSCEVLLLQMSRRSEACGQICSACVHKSLTFITWYLFIYGNRVYDFSSTQNVLPSWYNTDALSLDHARSCWEFFWQITYRTLYQLSLLCFPAVTGYLVVCRQGVVHSLCFRVEPIVSDSLEKWNANALPRETSTR